MAQHNPGYGQATKRSLLTSLLASYKRAFVGIGLFSGVINILALTGSLFMLQVYDRVLPSHSVPTLVALIIIAGAMYVFLGLLELVRSRLLLRIGVALDEKMGRDAFAAVMRLPLRIRLVDGQQPIRDLDQVRSFMASGGLGALFDLPWLPIYIGICFIFHFWIGVAAALGAVILVGLTLLTEFMTRQSAKQAAVLAARRNAWAEAARTNAEVVRAMGFAGRIAGKWNETNAEFQEKSTDANDVVSTLSTVSRVFRMMLQSGVLAIGAWLVIEQEATGGIMIASSIMVSRALAPVEMLISQWKGFVAARQSWRQLNELVHAAPDPEIGVELTAPAKSLSVERMSLVPPGDTKIVVQDVEFRLAAGAGLGIIGPSASGKSSLVKAVVGVWAPLRGAVRLDGAALDQWSPEVLGRHIGYLPQDLQMFSGTIAENISRFDPEASPEKIFAAAAAAAVHDMIVRLPEGYETQMGPGGTALSTGQRQRIALARALYGDPFLVVLDEPNSNLDNDGERALAEATLNVRKRGGIVILVAHRPSALATVDQVLVMNGGRVQAFGPRDEILAQLVRPPEPVPVIRTATPAARR